jgi:hypothetical protein
LDRRGINGEKLMIPSIPSTKCTRGPEYTRGGRRQLWYFSTLTHSLPTLGLARELRFEWSSSLLLLHCVSVVLCVFFVLSLEQGCPSIDTWRRGGVVTIPGTKPMHHRLLHGGMQLPREGEDERCQQGAGRPLTTASGHRLRVAGHGLDLHCSPVEFCFVWVELIGVFVITLRDSVSEKRLSVNFSCILCLWPTKHACTKTCGKCELKSLILSLVVEKQNSSWNKVTFPISHLSNLEFWKFFSKKHSSLYTPQIALSNHLMVYKSLPRHSNVLSSFVFSYF